MAGVWPELPTPEPVVTEETVPYWDAAAEGRLLLPRCVRCSHVIWYPRSFCPECGSLEVSWFEASGRGEIYSFSVLRQSQGDYSAATPYVLAYVELEEGPRVLTNLVELEATPRIGQKVQAAFATTPGGAGLLRFRP